MAESVSIGTTIADVDVGGSANSLSGALSELARDCGREASTCEDAARALRRAEAFYHQAAGLIMTSPMPEVGDPPKANHNESEGDDDGRHEHDFEVGSKG